MNSCTIAAVIIGTVYLALTVWWARTMAESRRRWAELRQESDELDAELCALVAEIRTEFNAREVHITAPAWPAVWPEEQWPSDGGTGGGQ